MPLPIVNSIYIDNGIFFLTYELFSIFCDEWWCIIIKTEKSRNEKKKQIKSNFVWNRKPWHIFMTQGTSNSNTIMLPWHECVIDSVCFKNLLPVVDLYTCCIRCAHCDSLRHDRSMTMAKCYWARTMNNGICFLKNLPKCF